MPTEERQIAPPKGSAVSAPGEQTAPRGARALLDSPNAYRVALFFLLAASFLVYCGTFGFDFVYDDKPQIVRNLSIQSWRFLPRYFTRHIWVFLNLRQTGNYYRPLFLLWLRLNHALFGLSPGGWHLSSLLLHVAVTWLVFKLSLRLVRDRSSALFGAAIFALHPVHVESVAWISGVPDLLVGTFLLASFLSYVAYREGSPTRRSRLALSLLFYAAAMLAKEIALVLPLIVFAYDWRVAESVTAGSSAGVHRPRWVQAVRAVVPYALLTVPYLGARLYALRGFGHALTPLPLGTILLTIPSVLWFYARLFVWPIGLSPFYDTPSVTAPVFGGFFLPALGVLGLGLSLAVCTWRSRERWTLLLSVAWLVLPILPVLDFRVFADGEIAHDRYLYLPSVGFAILAGFAWRWGKGRLPAARRTGVGLTLGAAITGALAVATVLQTTYWSNNLVLYTRGVRIAPHNPLALTNLATEACERQYSKACIGLFKRALEINPRFWLALYNLGYTYYRHGNLAEADRALSFAQTINPDDADGVLYWGLTRYKMGLFDDAVALLRRAISIRPEAPGYHFALGVVLETKGDRSGALQEFEAELENNPDESAARAKIAELETSKTRRR